MDREARVAWVRERRARALREIGACVEALEEEAAGRTIAARGAEMKLRRLLTTLRDDVPPELLERARAALGE